MSGSEPALAFERVLAKLQQSAPGKRLLVLVDEAEILLDLVSQARLSQAVLAGWERLRATRGVSFCFTGSPDLVERVDAGWPGLGNRVPPRHLGALDRADALRLIREPVAGSLSYPDEVAGAIWQLCGGQPFYTQLVCTCLVEQLNLAQRRTVILDDVNEVVLSIVADPPPMLRYEWDVLDAAEQGVLSLLCGAASSGATAEGLLAEARRQGLRLEAEELAAALARLVEAGHLRCSEQGTHAFQNGLFREWIRKTHAT